jgi:hypothetical protein
MGKAKRFNPYDDSVAQRRKLIQEYGQVRQERAGVSSSFRQAPQPPIATSTGATNGTGDGTFLTASLSADQTTNIAATDHIEFDTKDEDGGIVLQTGAGQADGIFELSSGKKYQLSAHLRPEFSGATGQLVIAWYDITNTAEIGSQAIYESQTHASHNANQPVAEAIITPATNITVEVRIIAVTALTALANEYSTANLFEIALGGSGGGGTGGGTNFPLDYGLDNQGNKGGVTVTHDLSATTAHDLIFTATGDVTLAFSNYPGSTGIDWYVEITQDSTGGHAITWPSEITPVPSFSTAASTTSLVALHTSDGGTTVRAVTLLNASAGVGAGANTALSNLTGVAINTSLVSDTDNTDDLGTSSVKWRDLFLNRNIRFGVGGQILPTEPTIWVDASGDMVNNVATGDDFFWTINNIVIGQLQLDSFEVRTVTQHGPDIILNNNNQSPLDNDIVGQIFYKARDDGLNVINWGAIEFEQNDVSEAAKQASYKVHCQSDNILQPILDYSGSDGVFRFSSGVDVVRPNADNAKDLGATAQAWKDFYIAGTTTWNQSGHGHTLVPSATAMTLNMGANTDSFTLNYVDAAKTTIFTDNHVDTRSDAIGWFFESIYSPAVPADNDVIALYQWNMKNSIGTVEPHAEMRITTTDVTDGTEDADFDFYTMNGGTLDNIVRLDGSVLQLKMLGHSIDMATGDIDDIGQLNISSPATYNESNVVTDRTYDANSTTVAELADVLGTLIADLRTIGIVN